MCELPTNEEILAHYAEGGTLDTLYERWPELRPSQVEIERNQLIAELRREGYMGLYGECSFNLG